MVGRSVRISRDGPTVPDLRVAGLPVPLEMSNVLGFEVDGVTVVGTQDRDACVRFVRRRVSGGGTPPGLSLRLSEDEGRNECANEMRRADDDEPTVLDDSQS
jgi:hypothetical protein